MTWFYVQVGWFGKIISGLGRGSPQVNTEKTLRELLVQYEANQKEQARETKKAFYVSLAALALNALAIIVTIAIAVLN